MKRIITGVLVCLLVLSVLVGCGGKTQQDDGVKANNQEDRKITLTWMNHTGEDTSAKWEDEMAKKFMGENENIKVDIQRMSFDNYVTTLQTKIASSDAPDLFVTEGEQLRKFAENGYLADLSNEDFIENFDKDDLAALTVDDKILAVNNTFGTMCVTYNREVFKEAGITEVPRTLDEFYDVCSKLEAHGVFPIANGFKESWCVSANMQTDYITSVLAKDENAIIDVVNREKKFVDSDLWRDEFTNFIERYKYSNDDPFGTDWNAAGDLLATGKAGMILNGYWTVTHVRSKNPNVNLGIFPMPISNEPGDAVLLIQSPTQGTAVFDSSPNKDVALEFLAFISTPEAATYQSELTNQPTIVKGATAPDDDPVLKDIYSYVDSGNTFNQGAIDHNFPNEQRTAVETLVSKHLLSEEKDVEKLLKDLDEEFDKIAKTAK